MIGVTGVATMEQTGTDEVTLSWEATDGTVVALPMSLREAAALQDGKPVSGYGRARHFSLSDRRAALVARNDQIGERMAELEAQYPQLRDRPEDGAA